MLQECLRLAPAQVPTEAGWGVGGGGQLGFLPGLWGEQETWRGGALTAPCVNSPPLPHSPALRGKWGPQPREVLASRA